MSPINERWVMQWSICRMIHFSSWDCRFYVMYLLCLSAQTGSRRRPSWIKSTRDKYSSEMMKKGRYACSLFADTNKILVKREIPHQENCCLDLFVKLYWHECSKYIPGFTKMIYLLFFSTSKITTYSCTLLPTNSLFISSLQSGVFVEGSTVGESYQQDCTKRSRYNVPHLWCLASTDKLFRLFDLL